MSVSYIDKRPSADIVAKAGLWYTISNFTFRAVAFITTPIFARILSKNEYGEFNNITSWVAIFFILTSCDLYTSIIRAKLDYQSDLDRYSLSILTLESIITFFLFVLTMLFKGFFSDIMGIEEKYFLIMFIYLFFVQGFYVFITNERAHYKYKIFSVITGVGIVASCLLSVLLVIVMKNKLDARVYGQYIPYIIIGFVLYILVIKNGKSIHLPYYKYGLMLSVPLVPHLLSMTILSSSDKIMITKLSGVEFTAIYSVAYIVANIVTILIDSMNKAWAPWFLESIKAGDLKAVQKVTIPYAGIFFGLIFGLYLTAPEVVLILGGKQYQEGIYVLPPLIAGCAFQFIYTMYVQVEFYEKKMKMVAFGTTIAAVINIFLNYLLIPVFGYKAAGYTTLFGYMVLFVIHYITVCKLGYKKIFNRRLIFGGLFLVLITIPFAILLYHNNLVRYLAIAIYMLVLCTVFMKSRGKIIRILDRKK